MSIFELFIPAVALSMDAFAVSVCKGLAMGKPKLTHSCICGAWFGGFQALMPLLGYLLGTRFSVYITQYDHWVAFVLLVIIGAMMVKESFDKDDEVQTVSENPVTFKVMLPMAVATSIDALAVGVTFAFLQMQLIRIILAVCFIGVITFILSAVGVRMGGVFGTKYKSRAEICGGIILILLGIKILLEHLGVFEYLSSLFK